MSQGLLRLVAWLTTELLCLLTRHEGTVDSAFGTGAGLAFPD